MNKYFFYLILMLIFFSCSDNLSNIPVDKPYWTAEDYDQVVFKLKYNWNKDEKLPAFDDPETSIIIKKLTDENNYLVVLDDPELGIKYLNDQADKFFDAFREMTGIYTERDRTDKFVYGKEYIAVYQFGLGLQMLYFKIGNDNIRHYSDNPESESTKRRVKSNLGTLVSNYSIYLELIDEESSFSNEEISFLAEGIDKYFTQLVNTYPDLDYKSILKKIESLEAKTNSFEIKNSLEKLHALILSKGDVPEL